MLPKSGKKSKKPKKSEVDDSKPEFIEKSKSKFVETLTFKVQLCLVTFLYFLSMYLSTILMLSIYGAKIDLVRVKTHVNAAVSPMGCEEF